MCWQTVEISLDENTNGVMIQPYETSRDAGLLANESISDTPDDLLLLLSFVGNYVDKRKYSTTGLSEVSSVYKTSLQLFISFQSSIDVTCVTSDFHSLFNV